MCWLLEIGRESRRRWKVITLAIGLLLLIVGSFYYQAPDWDIPISLIMAFFTYLLSGWSMHVIVERRWRQWPAMLLATWWCVDGCYALYWSIVNPEALAFMRAANAPASLCLFFACGLVWYWNGTVNEAIAAAKKFSIGRNSALSSVAPHVADRGTESNS